ncbi:hypothetical protein BX666DRAFT_2117772 [Dichotomocladium elegans]|nr:hypothetical protein BX666DRAFT_2117772 [Dichotomocladium elegans]
MAESNVSVIKTSLRYVGWKQEYQEMLKKPVQTTHFLITRTLFLNLSERKVLREKVKPSTKAIRTLIQRHFKDYTKSADIEPGQHCNMSQVAAYVSTDIMTAYKVNAQLRFDEHKFQPILAELSPILQAYDDTLMRSQKMISTITGKSGKVNPAPSLSELPGFCPTCTSTRESSASIYQGRHPLKHRRSKRHGGKVLDLKSKAFKDRHGRSFLGTIQTDGLSISVILKTPDAKRNFRRKRNRADDDGKSSKGTRRKQ